MTLYRELSAAAQAAYAELFEQVQVSETMRSPAWVSGNVQWKTVKGRRYGYWAFKELDGRKREYYLGPEGPAIDAIENAAGKPVPALESIARQANAALALGNAATPPRHFRIIKRFAEYQFFRAGGLLVGTQAFLAIGNQLGLAWTKSTRTLDPDFAHNGPGGNLAVALPADLRANVAEALKSLQMGFLPALGGTRGLASQYASESDLDLRVDFLTSTRRKRDDVPAPELGVALAPLKFMDYLLLHPGQAVLIGRGNACLINLPDPARYGLHKLLVASERGPGHAKYKKDIAQALALIEWHLDHAPVALLDAWNDLARRGSGWVKRARQSLAAAPDSQQDLVGRFENLIRGR